MESHTLDAQERSADIFMDFHRFSLIFMDFHGFPSMSV